MTRDKYMLQRFHDGELEPEERARVERELTDADRAQLAAYAEVGDLVRGALDAEAADIDLWPGLDGQLGGDLGKRRAERAAPRRSSWLRSHWVASTGLAVAAAASLMLFVRHPTAAVTNNCD